jgi:hypothetical protein
MDIPLWLLRYVGKGWAKLQQYRQKRAGNKISSAQKARRKRAVYDFIAWKYQDGPLLRREGETYPVWVFPVRLGEGAETGGQLRNPDSVLEPLGSAKRGEQSEPIRSEDYRKTLIRAGRLNPRVNRKTLVMDTMATDGRLRIACRMGRYFDGLDTCDAFEWELLRNAKHLNSSDAASFGEFDGRLPLRRRLHESVQDPLRNGSRRSAVLGISVLIAYRENGDYYLMLRRRSSTRVAAHPRGIHVIPSFMFQPATDELHVEYSVVHNIYREYLEELFDRPDMEPRTGTAKFFYGDACFRILREMLDDGRAEMYLSGSQ